MYIVIITRIVFGAVFIASVLLDGSNVKNRSNLEIIALILEVCNGRRATRVRIMFKAYLSYLQLKEYLPLLLERGLLEYNEKDRVYSTTLRGAHFLEIYNEMSGILVHRKPL